jgi:hypothetical protein
VSEPISPERALRDAVAALYKPGDEVVFLTDDRSYTEVVLLAVAIPAGTCVIEIERHEWKLASVLKLAEILGFKPAEKAPAIERAMRAKGKS